MGFRGVGVVSMALNRPLSFDVLYYIPYVPCITLHLKQIAKNYLSTITDTKSSDFKYAPQGSLGVN
jgi:CRISPR/Cas system CMR subunit Cmr6 (Cas7 group RAMP superfamily)